MLANQQGSIDRNDCRTPRWFFEQCVNRFGDFDIDVAATADNALCPAWCRDGLAEPWGGQCWCNPPYGPPGTIERWIAKARDQRDQRGVRTLMLLPADTSTRWYHDVSRTELCELVPFRLAFETGDDRTKGNSAKFGSVLVWIAPKIAKPNRVILALARVAHGC